MKIIVRTTKSHLVWNRATGEMITPTRPHVIASTNFSGIYLANGHLRTLASNLPDEASDKDFEEFWLACDKDDILAVESFVSQFAV